MKFELEFQRQRDITIQSSGALLAYRLSDERVALASANCRDFLGYELKEPPLGRKVRDVIGADAFHAVRNASAMPSIRRRREHAGQHMFDRGKVDLTAFQSDDCIVIEVMDASSEPVPPAYGVLKDVLLIQDRILSAQSPDEIFRNIVTLLRTISGYDCVAACRYRENLSDVVASSGASLAAFETLETNAQLHILPSTQETPVVVHSLSDVDKLDLTLSGLRWPTMPSLEKLRRIGAQACLTQGIQFRDHIWGYLAFLHRTPHLPNHRTLLAMSHLQPVITMRLAQLS